MNETLSPDLEALLDVERGRTGAPASARSRVLERVQLSVAAHPVSGPAPRMSAAANAGGTLLRPVLAGALLLGVGAALVLASRRHPTTEPTAATTTAEAPVIPVVEPVVPEVVPPAAPVLVPPEPVVARVNPAAAKLVPPVSTMPAERTLLDRARGDLLSGEAPAALREIETHARLYRRGVLAEERDALRIEALVATQQYERARAAGARFRATYPGSMLGPAVDGTLRTIP
ncbi:MAG TPA: hypothetical protein VHS09_12455 [Polyangiaceae bacterium]|nr:hypothetical protein [Polyangiaceae bacterium]